MINTLYLFAVFVVYGILVGGSLNLMNYEAYEYATDLIPKDGAYYVFMADSVVDFISTVEWHNIIGGALNWLSLPLIYWGLRFFDPSPWMYFVIFNAVLVMISAYFYIKDADFFLLKSRTVFLAYIFMMPYIYAYILVPNKEIPVLAAIPILAFMAKKNRLSVGSVIAVFFGFFKIQVFGAWILLLISVRYISMRYIVLIVGIIYPIYAGLAGVVGMDEFLENTSEQPRTATLMMALEKIVKIPFGFLIVCPIRIILNIFAGFSFQRLSDAIYIVDYISFLSNLILTVVFMFWSVCIFFYGFKKWIAGLSVSDKYIFMYVFVLSFVPFLQSRYYWFLIPYFFFSGSRLVAFRA